MAQTDFKTELCEKICSVVHRYSADTKWHIDTMTEVLQMSQGVAPKFASNAVMTTVARSNLKAYATHKLYSVLETQPEEEALRVSALWCIGEYGNELISSQGANTASQTGDETFKPIPLSNIITLLKSNLENMRLSPKCKHYALTACLKLTTLNQSNQELKQIIAKYKHVVDLELQSRSVEFGALLSQSQKVLNDVLQPVPEPPALVLDKENKKQPQLKN
eukprot:UN33956